MADYDRQRSAGQRHDPTNPVNQTNRIYLPSQKFENWDVIKETARAEINDYMESKETSREVLKANKEAFAQIAEQIIQKNHKEWGVRTDQFALLTDYLYNELFSYGSLGYYLADPEIEDILLNNYQWMDIVKNGKKIPVKPTPFKSDQEVKQWLQTIVFNPLGKEFTKANPSENAILEDGSRLFAFSDPISKYTGFAIRRHRTEVFQTPADYINTGVANRDFFLELKQWVEQGRNMVIAGATGSGKTTMINFAASLIPSNERIITLEDTPELQIVHPRVLPLTTYEKGARAGQKDEKDIPMRDLLRYSLRLRPDRIIVGETRDAEAFDMLDVLNTGHAGSFTSLHSNSAADAILRLQSMAIRSSVDYPISALQDLIATVIDIVVHLKNFNGTRRVVSAEQVLYRHHYMDFDSIDDLRLVHPNLGMRRLWSLNKQTMQIEKIHDYLRPDHE